MSTDIGSVSVSDSKTRHHVGSIICRPTNTIIVLNIDSLALIDYARIDGTELTELKTVHFVGVRNSLKMSTN